MTSKKLGALLRSVPPATAEAAELQPMAPVSEESVNAGRLPAAPTAQPDVPLQVLIPANVRKQLALRAAEEGQSLRALMLRAIRSLGIEVTDADIAGKRGRRKP
jgi:hypothetical protein